MKETNKWRKTKAIVSPLVERTKTRKNELHFLRVELVKQLYIWYLVPFRSDYTSGNESDSTQIQSNESDSTQIQSNESDSTQIPQRICNGRL
jgi:hypothetical protein